MTPEQRLDRLERIAKLFATAGFRVRNKVSGHDEKITEHDEKLTAIINAQILNEDRFARLAESMDRLAESQAHSDRRLEALIDIVRRRAEGS